MEEDKQLVVFGGNGFVGSYFCNQLDKTKSISYKKPEKRTDYNCDALNAINFISTVDNYNVFKDPWVDIRTNLDILMTLLDSWRWNLDTLGNQDACFNLISSWFVYGADEDGVHESHPCDPKGFYSITKRCAEQLLISYCETYDLNYRILRLGNVIGVGDQKASKSKNAFQYMLKEIYLNRPIQVYHGGNFYRDFIDVRDCASAIELVLLKGNHNEIYNIGNGVPKYNFGQLMQMFKGMVDSKSEISAIEQKAFHQKVQSSKSFYADNTKLKSLGYQPKYPIEETLTWILQSLESESSEAK